MTDKTPTASKADGNPRSTELLSGLFASIVTFGGAVNVGAVVSITVIFCTAFAMFPPESVAVQVTMVVPSGTFCGASLVIEITVVSSVAVA